MERLGSKDFWVIDLRDTNKIVLRVTEANAVTCSCGERFCRTSPTSLAQMGDFLGCLTPVIFLPVVLQSLATVTICKYLVTERPPCLSAHHPSCPGVSGWVSGLNVSVQLRAPSQGPKSVSHSPQASAWLLLSSISCSPLPAVGIWWKCCFSSFLYFVVPENKSIYYIHLNRLLLFNPRG